MMKNITSSPQETTLCGRFDPPLSQEAAKSALADITNILHLKQKIGIGHKSFQGDELLRQRLGMMKMHLHLYTTPPLPNWIAASLQTAQSHQKLSHTAKKIRQWSHSFIVDQKDILFNLYGAWNVSLLEKGELATEIHAHLQQIGKYVKAQAGHCPLS
jgi:hypothetical protein